MGNGRANVSVVISTGNPPHTPLTAASGVRSLRFGISVVGRSQTPTSAATATEAATEAAEAATEATSAVAPAAPPAAEAAADLIQMSEDILAPLKRYHPVTVEGVDPTLHWLAPHIPKVRWTALGDAVVLREKRSSGAVKGEKWISLRLDGSNFSKTVRQLRRNGVLEGDGFSERMATTMPECLRALMLKFSAPPTQ